MAKGLLDYSSYGWKEACIRFIKVVGYVMLSGAIAALGAYFANFQIDTANIYQVSILALVNGFIASVSKWLGSVNPTKVTEI